jgi:predicted DNA-binding transcriptional regulator
MTKKEAVKRQIQSKGEGYEITPMRVWFLAGEVECSASTVYAAIREMKRDGLIDSANTYIGRQWIPGDVLAAAMQHETILTDAKIAELAREWFASKLTVRRSIYAAVNRTGHLKELNGGNYGYMVRAA